MVKKEDDEVPDLKDEAEDLKKIPLKSSGSAASSCGPSSSQLVWYPELMEV